MSESIVSVTCVALARRDFPVREPASRMGLRRYIPFALPVLLLAGCATEPSYWLFPAGTSQQQASQDEYACLQESQQQTSNASVSPYGGSAQSGSTANYILYSACMKARGYRSVKKSELPQPPPKEKYPEELYTPRAQTTINNRKCAENGSLSPELAAAVTRFQERDKEYWIFDERKFSETLRREEVTHVSNCEQHARNAEAIMTINQKIEEARK